VVCTRAQSFKPSLSAALVFFERALQKFHFVHCWLRIGLLMTAAPLCTIVREKYCPRLFACDFSRPSSHINTLFSPSARVDFVAREKSSLSTTFLAKSAKERKKEILHGRSSLGFIFIGH